MSDRKLTRRDFMTTGGGVITGSLVFTSGAIALMAPTQTWALELSTLNAHQGATMLQYVRHLYPHDNLEDAVYALVVKDLDGGASDAASAKLLTDGIAELDTAAGGKWLDVDAATQLELVTASAATPFFAKVRSTAVVSLYNNEMAFAHFGYEGPAYAKGGYLERGFNDLDWLPAPPAAASPAPYLGDEEA